MTHVEDAEMFVGELEGFSDPQPNTPEEFSIAVLAGKVDALTEQVKALTEKQNEIAGMLGTVVEQVGPTLDSLSSHPMFKMMFGGK